MNEGVDTPNDDSKPTRVMVGKISSDAPASWTQASDNTPVAVPPAPNSGWRFALYRMRDGEPVIVDQVASICEATVAGAMRSAADQLDPPATFWLWRLFPAKWRH